MCHTHTLVAALPAAVRDLIELGSDDLDNGPHIAISNQRAVATRAPTSGCDQLSASR